MKNRKRTVLLIVLAAAICLGTAGFFITRALLQPKTDTSVDIDLTGLEGCDLCDTIYIMLGSGDEYVGKTVKMHGYYSVWHNEETDQYFHACVADDPDGISMALEFTLDDSYRYPEDYPSLLQTFTVKGTLATYDEDGIIYGTLNDAEIKLD